MKFTILAKSVQEICEEFVVTLTPKKLGILMLVSFVEFLAVQDSSIDDIVTD